MIRRGSEFFHDELRSLGDLHDKKQEDYGTDADPFANVRAAEEFGVPAWLGCLIRMNDKMSRLKNFAKKGSLSNESVEDSLRDLAVYSLIALCIYREEPEADVDVEAGIVKGFTREAGDGERTSNKQPRSCI